MSKGKEFYQWIVVPQSEYGQSGTPGVSGDLNCRTKGFPCRSLRKYCDPYPDGPPGPTPEPPPPFCTPGMHYEPCELKPPWICSEPNYCPPVPEPEPKPEPEPEPEPEPKPEPEPGPKPPPICNGLT